MFCPQIKPTDTWHTKTVHNIFYWWLLKAVAAAVYFAVWSERRRLAMLWQNSPIHSPRVIKSPPVVDAPSPTPYDKTLGEDNVQFN